MVDFQKNEQLEQHQQTTTNFMSNDPSKSHINLASLSSAQKKRQRPQTSKVNRTVGIGQPVASQFQVNDAFRHKRLPSAKVETSYKRKVPAESQFSNTRDVIQSMGLLSVQTSGILNNNEAAQYQQPIVRQHFAPTPKNKLLNQTQSNRVLVQGRHNAGKNDNKALSIKPQHRRQRPKSGVTTGGQSRAGTNHAHAVSLSGIPEQPGMQPGLDGQQGVYRLPSLSQCIGNQILPRNSEFMKRLYQIAVRNHQSQVATVIRNEEERNRVVSQNKQAQADQALLDQQQNPNGQWKKINIKDLQLPVSHLEPCRNVTVQQQQKLFYSQKQHRRNDGYSTQKFNTENPIKIKDGIDIFNNAVLNNLNLKNAQILSGDKRIKEYAARQSYLNSKRNALSRRKKKRDKLMVVGNQGLPGDKSNFPNSKQTHSSPDSKNTQVIPIHMQDGQLVHFPESQMNDTQIKQMKKASDIENLLKNQGSNKVHVVMQDVNTGEQHLVMYQLNENANDTVTSGGVIAGGKGNVKQAIGLQLHQTESPSQEHHSHDGSEHTATQEESKEKAPGQAQRKSLNKSQIKSSEYGPKEDDELIEDDGLSNSGLAPKEANLTLQSSEGDQKLRSAVSQLQQTRVYRKHDTTVQKPISANMRQRGQFQESSKRSATLSSNFRSGRRRKLKKNEGVSSTHSLQLAVPNQYTNRHQPREIEKESDKQTNRIENLSQDVSIYGNDDHSPKLKQSIVSQNKLTASQEELKQSTAYRPRSSKATVELKRVSTDKEGVHAARRRQVSVLTGNQSEKKNGQTVVVGQDAKAYESVHMKNVHQIPLATYDRGSAEHEEMVAVVGRSRASREVADRQTLTHAMDSNTSRMSNPLNQFALSDRMRPTHNPIKLKNIPFEEQRRIREVDSRGHSRLELENTTYLNSKPYEIISQGSGGVSQGKNYVQNQDMIHIEKNLSPRFKQKFQEQTQAIAYKFKGKQPLRRDRSAGRRSQDASSASPHRPAKPQQNAGVLGRRARLHSAQYRVKGKAKRGSAAVADSQFKIMTQLQKDVPLDQADFLLGNTQSGGWLLQDGSKATILNQSQVVQGFMNQQNSQGEIRLPISPLFQGSMSSRSFNKTLTQEQIALQSFNANNVRANMRGQNAQQLIEGIQLHQSGGVDLQRDFQAAINGTGEQLVPHPRMSTGVEGHERGVDSQRSLEDLLASSNAALDQNLQSFNARDGDQDLSTLNPMEVPQPIFSEAPGQQKRIEPMNYQSIQVIKKSEGGLYESIEQTGRILNVGQGTIEEQAEAEEDAEAKRLRASRASVHTERHSASKDGKVVVLKIEQKPMLRKQKSTQKATEQKGKGIQSVYDAEAEAYRTGTIGVLATPKSLRSSRSRRQIGNENMDIQGVMHPEKTPTIDDCFAPHQRSQRSVSSRNRSKTMRKSSSGLGSRPRSNRSRRALQQRGRGSSHLTESIAINIRAIGGSKSPGVPRAHPPVTVQTNVDQHMFNSHQENARLMLTKARELLQRSRVLKTDPAVVNQQLRDMLQGKINDFSVIHKYLDKTTADVLDASLNQVQKINIPLSAKKNQEEETQDLSRQDGVQTDLDVRGDPEKLTATLTANKQSALAVLEPIFADPIATAQEPVTVASGSTLKNAGPMQPFTGIAFGVNSAAASSSRFSKTSLPQFKLLSSRFAGDYNNSTARVEGDTAGDDRLNAEVNRSSAWRLSDEAWNFPGRNNRPLTSKHQRAYRTNVIDYSGQVNGYEKLMASGSTSQNPSESAYQRPRAKNQRPRTAGRVQQARKQPAQKSRQLSSAVFSPAEVEQTQVTSAQTFSQNPLSPTLQQVRAMQAQVAKGQISSKFNQTTYEQQATQASKFVIEERQRFQPVLRGNQRSKRMVSQGVNTNEEEGEEAGKRRVNIRMKRPTLDDFEIGPIEFGEVVTAEYQERPGTQPGLVLHLATPSSTNQLVIDEVMEHSARSNHIESQAAQKNLFDSYVRHSANSNHIRNPAPDDLLVRSVLTSPPSSQFGGSHNKDLIEAKGLEYQPFVYHQRPTGQGSQTRLVANGHGSQANLDSRRGSQTNPKPKNQGQVLERKANQGYIPRSKAHDSHFSVKNALTNSRGQL